MALTRDFRETIAARAQRDPRFREALFTEAINAYLAGDTAEGKATLRDLVNATVGFEGLAVEVGKPSKSLHRMLAPRGNPNTENFFEIVSALQRKTRVRLRVIADAAAVQYSSMKPSELAEATATYGREMVVDEFRPLSGEARKRWLKARRKPGSQRVGIRAASARKAKRKQSSTAARTTSRLVMNRTKLEPIHPGEILAEEFMAPLELSANALARKLAVPVALITELIRGRRRVTADTAMRLAKFLGTSEELWLGLQTEYDLRKGREKAPSP